MNETQNPSLPDLQKSRTESSLEMQLQWVGMSEIETPIRYRTRAGQVLDLAAKVEAGVNLVDSEARGIHMSRLYRTIVEALPQKELNFPLLQNLIENFLESHRGLSTEAEIQVRFEALLPRQSLKSGLQGYRSYPVEMRVVAQGQSRHCWLSTEIVYASTCPQSAALARGLVAQDFQEQFPDALVPALEVRSWLASPAGMKATPHAQRSRARVQVELKPEATLNLEYLIDLVEKTLATPVQTVVKREDEQEFARQNGTHLMFCEDAARKVQKALLNESAVADFEAEFRHLESLHPHDAVARIRGRRPLSP